MRFLVVNRGEIGLVIVAEIRHDLTCQSCDPGSVNTAEVVEPSAEESRFLKSSQRYWSFLIMSMGLIVFSMLSKKKAHL